MSLSNDLKLCVKCLPFDVERRDLFQIFGKFGRLKLFIVNPQSCRSCRTAFITFVSVNYVNDALKCNGTLLRGHTLSVEQYKQNNQKGRQCIHSIEEGTIQHDLDKFKFEHKPIDRVKEIRILLNKISEKNFKTVGPKIENLILNTKDKITLNDVTKVFFDKILLDTIFCPLYAKLCKNISNKCTEFRKILLNSCQSLFDQNIQNTVNIEQKPKMLNNIRFIAELFKIGMLPVDIMYDCINILLNINSDENDIEQLCNLLKNIGPDLNNKSDIDDVFKSLETLITSRQLCNRIKFMIQDLISLKNNNWNIKQEIQETQEIKKNSSMINNTINMIFDEYFETNELDSLTYGLENDFKSSEYVSVFGDALLIYCNNKDKIKNIINILNQHYKEYINSTIKYLFNKIPLIYIDYPNISDIMGFIMSEILYKNPDLSFLTWDEFKNLSDTKINDNLVEKCIIYLEIQNQTDIIRQIRENHNNVPHVLNSRCYRNNSNNNNMNDFKIFVKCLPRDTTRYDIINIFKKMGKLKIFMMNDKVTQKFKGMAIITFESKEFVTDALKFNGTIFNQNKISVQNCK